MGVRECFLSRLSPVAIYYRGASVAGRRAAVTQSLIPLWLIHGTWCRTTHGPTCREHSCSMVHWAFNGFDPERWAQKLYRVVVSVGCASVPQRRGLRTQVVRLQHTKGWFLRCYHFVPPSPQGKGEAPRGSGLTVSNNQRDSVNFLS
jgi:hypothetical protein